MVGYNRLEIMRVKHGNSCANTVNKTTLIIINPLTFRLTFEPSSYDYNYKKIFDNFLILQSVHFLHFFNLKKNGI